MAKGFLWYAARRHRPHAGPLSDGQDFSHDNEMISILSALDIRQPLVDLPTDHVPDKRTWITSDLIAFGSRIIFERVGCELGSWEPDPEMPPGEGQGDDRKNYLRVFIK